MGWVCLLRKKVSMKKERRDNLMIKIGSFGSFDINLIQDKLGTIPYLSKLELEIPFCPTQIQV